jgi:hypothetical protein
MTSVLIVPHSACLTWASVGHIRYNDSHEYRQRTNLDRYSRLFLPMQFEHCSSRPFRQEVRLQI